MKRGRLSREQIREIADRVDIVSVIGEVVSLRKAGSSHKGLCPFHDEKTPSFHVNPQRQTFHCFGCGKGGDVITFFREYHNLEFMDALEEVARRAGVELPRGEQSPEERHAASLRTRLTELNEIAAAHYHGTLRGPQGAPARAYLERRGISDEMIERFGLGYAPDGWEHLTGELTRRRLDRTLAEQVGLIRPGRRGGYYDFFRNRLMIPIHDVRGKVVAFGGRDLGDDGPKYLNSPESPVYDKSRTLYGLSQASRAIRSVDQALIVEGYFDAISLVSAGIEHVVAPCGTALTAEQLRTLRRHTTTIVLVYDADDAGIAAACRSLDLFLEQDLWPLFLAIPDGQDPDEFVRSHGGDAFRELLADAGPLLDRYLTEAILRHEGAPRAAERVVEEVAPTLHRLEPITAAPYWARIADRLRVEERLVMAFAGKLRRGARRAPAPVAGDPPLEAAPLPREEWSLLALLIHRPEPTARDVVGSGITAMMQSEVLAELVQDAAEETLGGTPPQPVHLLDRTEDDALRRELARMIHSEELFPEDQAERASAELILRIRTAYLRRQLDEARRRSKQATGLREQQEAAAEMIRLSRELKASVHGAGPDATRTPLD